MSMPVLVAGIILSCIWLLATVIVKPKKRKILMIIGVATCFILLIYTLKWKPFVYGILGGVFVGAIGIGYKQDELLKLHKQMGVVQTMIIFAIVFVLVFMSMALAAPDLKW